MNYYVSKHASFRCIFRAKSNLFDITCFYTIYVYILCKAFFITWIWHWLHIHCPFMEIVHIPSRLQIGKTSLWCVRHWCFSDQQASWEKYYYINLENHSQWCKKWHIASMAVAWLYMTLLHNTRLQEQIIKRTRGGRNLLSNISSTICFLRLYNKHTQRSSFHFSETLPSLNLTIIWG